MHDEQQTFWRETYAEEYISKNRVFDNELGVSAWKEMLRSCDPISDILECGSNVGRNIGFLENVLPEASKSVIELSKGAFNEVTSRYNIDKSFNGPICDADFEERSFSLVYTMGVLIHIHPENLLENMKKMFALSGKYILMGEYFNRTPTSLIYQGEKDKLFKRDFGKLFLQNFRVQLIDYGFLWGHIYDEAGFDDVTWWLFEKIDH